MPKPKNPQPEGITYEGWVSAARTAPRRVSGGPSRRLVTAQLTGHRRKGRKLALVKTTRKIVALLSD